MLTMKLTVDTKYFFASDVNFVLQQQKVTQTILELSQVNSSFHFLSDGNENIPNIASAECAFTKVKMHALVVQRVWFTETCYW